LSHNAAARSHLKHIQFFVVDKYPDYFSQTFAFQGHYALHVEIFVDMNEGKIIQLVGEKTYKYTNYYPTLQGADTTDQNYAVFDINPAKTYDVVVSNVNDVTAQVDCRVFDTTSIEYAIVRRGIVESYQYHLLPKLLVNQLKIDYGFIFELSRARRERKSESGVIACEDYYIKRILYVVEDENLVWRDFWIQ